MNKFNVWATLHDKNRAKESVIISFLLTFSLFSIGSQALTINLKDNGCVYQKSIDMDYCRSVYEVTNLTGPIELSKLLFLYNTEKELNVDRYLKNIDIEGIANFQGISGKYINISGFKNPFKNIDNIPCYDNECFYQYAWWNSSFPYKYNITGRAYLFNNITDFYLVNDTYMLFNNSNHLIWCNYTVFNGTSHKLVGYFYFRDNTTYACIDINDSARVDMFTEEMQGGNNYNAVFNQSLVLWLNLSTNGADQSNYHFSYTTIGTPFISGGVVGKGMGFNADYYNFSDHPEHNGSTAISFGGWMFFNESTAPMGKGFNSPACGWEIYYGSTQIYCSVRVATSWLQSNIGISDNKWYHIFCTYDGSYVRLYVNGNLADSDLGAGGSITPCNKANLIIGGAMDDADGMVGNLDDIRIYNYTLTASQIMNIYNNTNGTMRFLILDTLIYNESANASLSGGPGNATEELNLTDVIFSECYGEHLLLKREKCCADDGNLHVNTYFLRCDHGCSNTTWFSVGEAGCIENTLQITLFGILLIIIIVLLMKWWYR